MNYQHFYTALGQLIYSIAMADGAVQNEEMGKVFHFVVSQIVEIESDLGHGANGLHAFHTEKEFNRLKRERVSAETAFERFMLFLDEHGAKMNSKMRATCLHIMERVAKAHNGIEATEQSILTQIESRLVALGSAENELKER